MITRETTEVMSQDEASAFFHKLETFQYSLTDKERNLFGEIVEHARVAATRTVEGGAPGFDETVWLAAYTD